MKESREQVQQPLVVVAALFVFGAIVGWGVARYCGVAPLGMLWLALCGVVVGVVAYLWRGGAASIVTMIVAAGLFALSLSTLRHGDIYEASSLRYFDKLKSEVNEEKEGKEDTEERSYFDYRYAFPENWGERANNWARERIDSLGLENSRDRELVVAMVLGRKGGMDSELRSGYARSGSAHILALSGLHLGVIFLIVNLLLKPLNLLYRGHLLRNVLVVAAVWIYAYVVGMSASVVRAATMLSVLQLALFTARQYSSVNALAAAILFMVAVDVKSIFDVGFLLSVTAVAAIMLWALPIWGVLCREWYSKMNYLTRYVGLSLLIGLACSVATAPLVSYAFGYFTLWGVLLSPLLTITLTVVLVASIVWIFAGFSLLAPVFRWVIDGALWLQNGAVEVVSSGWGGWISAQEVRIEGVGVVAAYLLFAVFTILLRGAVAKYYAVRGEKWYDGVELQWGADADWDTILEEVDTMYEHEEAKKKRYN